MLINEFHETLFLSRVQQALPRVHEVLRGRRDIQIRASGYDIDLWRLEGGVGWKVDGWVHVPRTGRFTMPRQKAVSQPYADPDPIAAASWGLDKMLRERLVLASSMLYDHFGNTQSHVRKKAPDGRYKLFALDMSTMTLKCTIWGVPLVVHYNVETFEYSVIAKDRQGAVHTAKASIPDTLHNAVWELFQTYDLKEAS